jgi:phosphate transport system permease protein
MKNVSQRKLKDGLLYGLMIAALALVIAALGFILVYILGQSAAYLNGSLFAPDSPRSIIPMLITTIYLVLAAIAIALPVGIITAIYLNEYARDSAPVRLLRLAIETLAGIPSIIYGLFGLLIFCRFFNLGQSIISGALTLSIMILPVIIRTTEESLKTIPGSFREGSLSLGATKFQTILHVVLPQALPGIAASAILAVGRVVGESAPVLLTVGITKNIPRSVLDSGRTLTIHLYYLTKEAIGPDDFGIAFAASAVLIVLVLILNTATRIISGRFRKKLGGGL